MDMMPTISSVQLDIVQVKCAFSDLVQVPKPSESSKKRTWDALFLRDVGALSKAEKEK